MIPLPNPYQASVCQANRFLQYYLPKESINLSEEC
jgi:hypothetical protein